MFTWNLYKGKMLVTHSRLLAGTLKFTSVSLFSGQLVPAPVPARRYLKQPPTWHFLLLLCFRTLWWRMVVQLLSCVQLLRPHGLWPARLLCPWDSPGKHVGVGCHFLLQGIFLIQRLNPGLLHCRQILYWLSYEGSSWWRIPYRYIFETLKWIKI